MEKEISYKEMKKNTLIRINCVHPQGTRNRFPLYLLRDDIPINSSRVNPFLNHKEANFAVKYFCVVKKDLNFINGLKCD